MLTSTNDTKHVTLAVMIMADSTLLLSTRVFKEKPNDRITRSEFLSGNYLTTHFCKCQEAAWMDEDVMIAWVNQVLAPYLAAAPVHVVPVLILNMYQCHMMALVVQMIQGLAWR